MESARQVSLVSRLVIPFSGDVLPSAIAIGDVDRDGCNELVLGTTGGCLAVYKESQLVWHTEGLGTLKTVLIDRFLTQGGNCIIALSAEGVGYVFRFVNHTKSPTKDKFQGQREDADLEVREEEKSATRLEVEAGVDNGIGYDDDKGESNVENIAFDPPLVNSFAIPWNITAATAWSLLIEESTSSRVMDSHLDDIEPRKQSHLLVSWHDGGTLSQGAVGVLQLVKSDSGVIARVIHEWTLPQGAAVSLSYCSLGDCQLVLVGLNFGGILSIDIGTGAVMRHRLSDDFRRHLIAGDIRFERDDPDLQDDLLQVEKPTSVCFLFSESDDDEMSGSVDGERQLRRSASALSGVENMSNKDDTSSSEMAPVSARIAICFGGRMRIERLYLQEMERGNRVQLANCLVWQEPHQGRQLFSLQSLDMNWDCRSEIVSCAWDGLTCVYDLGNNVVRYQFEERVQAFAAGKMHIQDKVGTCFVYVTLSGYIAVYTNVHERLKTIPALTTWDVLRERGQLKYVMEALDAQCDPNEKERIMAKVEDNADAYYAQLLHNALHASN